MNSNETAILLAVAASFDSRTIGDADVNAWHAAMYDLDFIKSREAVIGHYRRSDDRITPAQIRHLVNTDSANKHVPRPPENIAQNPHEWRKRVSQQRFQGPLNNQTRRELVLRYPDIAAKLTLPPMSLARPDCWNGFIPAEDYEGPHGLVPNDSPIRAQLVAILDEAAHRADNQAKPATPTPETT
jgi:hypothetical protein